MLVLEEMGDQMVDAYSRMGRVMALYVFTIVSLCLPHLEEDRALRMLSVLRDLVRVCLVFSVYVSWVSKVMPRILEVFVVLMWVLSMEMLGWYLCS